MRYICSCEYENLGWAFDLDEEEGTFEGIILSCQECDEQLWISSDDLAAFFMFDKGYPKGPLPEEVEDEAPQLKLIRGGKDEMDS